MYVLSSDLDSIVTPDLPRISLTSRSLLELPVINTEDSQIDTYLCQTLTDRRNGHVGSRR